MSLQILKYKDREYSDQQAVEIPNDFNPTESSGVKFDFDVVDNGVNRKQIA